MGKHRPPRHHSFYCARNRVIPFPVRERLQHEDPILIIGFSWGQLLTPLPQTPSFRPFLPAVWWSCIPRLKISGRRNMVCIRSETDNWTSQRFLQFCWVSWLGDLLIPENREMTHKQAPRREVLASLPGAPLYWSLLPSGHLGGSRVMVDPQEEKFKVVAWRRWETR